MFDDESLALAEAVLDACRRRGWKLATAESCTGGLVAEKLVAMNTAAFSPSAASAPMWRPSTS